MLNRDALRLYFIMGSNNVLPNVDPLTVLEQALQGGVTIFQLREKGTHALQGDAYIQFAKDCQALCKSYNVPFIINDDVALAVAIHADGVHVGQDDAALHIVRKKIGHDKIVGISVHSIEEAERAIEGGADYVGIGPVFPTQSKADAKPPCGPAFLHEMASRFPHLPFVGIGGITEDNRLQVLEAGADGIAVISAISLQENPKQATQNLR